MRRLLFSKVRWLTESMTVFFVSGIFILCSGVALADSDLEGSDSQDPSNCKQMIEKYWSDTYGNLPLNKCIKNRNRLPCKKNFSWKLLAKAQPDECFRGIGNTLNIYDPTLGLGFTNNYPGDLTEEQKQACLDNDGQPKVNQAYVWGLVKYCHHLWFGTISNTHCLVIRGFLGSGESTINSSWVCEGEAGAIGDFRPPRMYCYDLKRKKLTEVTQKVIAAGVVDSTLLQGTIGIRSAGAARGVVFLGGINAQGGVNIFAFNARTKEYLGAKSYNPPGDGTPWYTNIRQWRMIWGQLYVGVGKQGGGEILRWTGKRSLDPEELFSFETVGEVQGDPAYLAYHRGRIFVNTWPAGINPMTIFMSPLLGGDDRMLTSADKSGWTPVWSIDEYEVEPADIFVTGGGALLSYKGYLYWGTMHVPGTGLLAFNGLYPGVPEEDAQVAALATYRPISIFRGKWFGTEHEKVQLLYGSSLLPQYILGTGWQIVPNAMGQSPRFGQAGFNNFFNNYTWWMEEYRGQLLVGTMDFLYLIGGAVRDLIDVPVEVREAFEKYYGADLWAFCQNYLPAYPVSLTGVGNYSSYGVRTMVSTRDALYLGMANPMNLMTDPEDDRPEGGWELIKLKEGWHGGWYRGCVKPRHVAE